LEGIVCAEDTKAPSAKEVIASGQIDLMFHLSDILAFPKHSVNHSSACQWKTSTIKIREFQIPAAGQALFTAR
jgi:hypothetical protein